MARKMPPLVLGSWYNSNNNNNNNKLTYLINNAGLLILMITHKTITYNNTNQLIDNAKVSGLISVRIMFAYVAASSGCGEGGRRPGPAARKK